MRLKLTVAGVAALSVITLLAGGAVFASPPRRVIPPQPRALWRPLTANEMKDAVGGIGTGAVEPSAQSQSGYDNIAFSLEWLKLSNDPMTYVVFADSTKTASRVISTAGHEIWSTRTRWPTDGTYRILRTGWFAENGSGDINYSGASHRVHPNVRMINVRFWNTIVNGVSTGISWSQVDRVVDNMDHNYAWNITQSIDAIYGQCSTLSQRMQFRNAGTPTLTMPASCPHPLPHPLPTNCMQDLYNVTTSGGTDNTSLNVIFFRDAPWNGIHGRRPDTANPTAYLIGIRSSRVSDPGFPATLAHEIGHYLLHPINLYPQDHAPTYNCGEAGEPVCGSDPARCGMMLFAGSRQPACVETNNLMCAGTDGFCGRRVTTGTGSQCARAASQWPFYYQDHN